MMRNTEQQKESETERRRDGETEGKEVGVLLQFGKEGIFPTLNDLSR